MKIDSDTYSTDTIEFEGTEYSLKDSIKEIIEEDFKKGPINNGKDCPDKSLILRFIQGNVNNQEHEDYIKHIAECNYCFVRTEQIRKFFIPVIIQLLCMQTYIFLLKTVKSRYFQTISLVCILIISPYIYKYFFNDNIEPDLLESINISCHSAINNNLVYHNKDLFKWEKEQDFIGFNFDIDPPLFKIAFAAGSWDSKNEINHSMNSMPDYLSIYKSLWEKTDNYIYYAIGKWHYMFTNTCLYGEKLPESFLKEQIKIIENIQNTFNKKEICDNIVVNKNLEKIQLLIKNSFTENNEEILKALNSIRNYLEPESIGNKL